MSNIEPWDDGEVVLEGETQEPEQVVNNSVVPEGDDKPVSEFAELEGKLGISLDEIGAEVEAEPEAQAEPQVPVGFEDFSKQFEQYLGFDLKSAKSMIEELQGFRTQYNVEQQKNNLRNEWGGEFDTRFQEVQQYFKTLPPAQQQALDNVDGAKLIWAKIAQQNQTRKPNVPTFVSSRGSVPSGTKDTINYSDIVAMSPKDYKANSAAIEAAFAEGRVNMNVENIGW